MDRILIVSVPGLNGTSQPWQKLEEAFKARDVFPNAEVNWLHYGLISFFSRRSLAHIARDLDARINQEWEKNDGYDRVILTGASMGALIARKAWLNAVDKEQGTDYTGSAWGAKVERFVLFAGLSRGVDVDKPWWWRIYARQIDLIPGRFTFEDCFRGSGFITDLRISWIRLINRLGDKAPMMLQLLGSDDWIVTKEDSIDLDVFPDTPPITVPDAAHHNAHWIERVKDPEGRLKLIIRQFQRELGRESVVQSNVREKRRVLMVVHGIRASKTDGWVEQTKQIVAQRWPDVVVWTPTYGYLSALRFAIPWIRRRYARNFCDYYTEVIAKHRNASVSVICHSNGTYALGQSLRKFNAIRLDRIALAASVLPPEFEWTKLCNSTRVSAVRSDSACRDYPVAVLCNALRGLGMRDVGPGGFDGFGGNTVEEVRYYNGGHSSMLVQSNLESMLEFLMDGSVAKPNATLISDPGLTRNISRAAVLLAWPLVLLLLAGIAFGTLTWGWWVLVSAVVALALGLFVLDIG